MRALAGERNLLLLLSLLIATGLWYYVAAPRTPPSGRTTTKAVAVIPSIVGEPTYGYSIIGVRVTPQAVMVTGEPALVEALQTVPTEPVNVTGALRDIVREVPVALPPGLTAAGRVRVAVQIAPAVAVRTIPGVRVQVRNAPAGVTARIEPETVEVRIQGPVTLVSGLRADSFVAVINGIDLSEGRRRIRVDVLGPEQVDVLAVSPPEVVVVVRKGG